MFLSSKMLFKKKTEKKDWARDIGVWEEVHWLGGKKKKANYSYRKQCLFFYFDQNMIKH
jgi:hypothetical protein